jgi:hypothetical protein
MLAQHLGLAHVRQLVNEEVLYPVQRLEHDGAAPEFRDVTIAEDEGSQPLAIAISGTVTGLLRSPFFDRANQLKSLGP